MIVRKITAGFVVQEFDTIKKKWTDQEFIAGDQVDYEDADGNPVDDELTPETSYLPFEMVQPEELD